MTSLYKEMLNAEAFLVQIIEVLELKGDTKEADYIRTHKDYLNRKRRKLKFTVVGNA